VPSLSCGTGTDAAQVNKLADQGGTQSPSPINQNINNQNISPITYQKINSGGMDNPMQYFDNGMNRKIYGQYLQSRGLQKWTKKRK
jgi:hypothetical protein